MATNRERLIKFGADATGVKQYTFPTFQGPFGDNFTNSVSRITRSPGMDGGYDQFGIYRFPNEIGYLRADIWLIDDDEDETAMTALEDAVRRLQAWGRQPLFLQPSNDAAPVRFCRAKIDNVQVTKDRSESFADLVRRVTINFSLNDPRWMSTSDADCVYWDDGTEWDSGAEWCEPRVVDAAVSSGDLLTVVNNGSADTPCRITVTVQTTISELSVWLMAENGVDRLMGGSYIGGLVGTDVLTIDSNFEPLVQVNQVGAYADYRRDYGNGFIMIPPGTHSIQVAGGFAGAVAVDIDYYDSWR